MKLGKTCISWLFLLSPLLSYAQTVDFSFSTDNGLYCNPQRVNFTQLCSGTPDGFIWKFGNGSSGIHPTESTTYSTPGTYSVTLIAIYANVAISATKTVVINPTPVMTVSADKKEICQPGPINFTASGSPGIISYEWNFGDGSPHTTTTTNTTSHTYSAYNDPIVFTVTGITAVGCSSSASDTLAIKRFSITDATIDPKGGCVPINIQLNVTSVPPVGDPAVNYAWNFGDGSPTANTSVPMTSHPYTITTPITTASVTVTTQSGCSNQFVYGEFGFGIPPTNPVAATQDGRTTYCASEIIKFQSAATNANYFLWEYGDGNKDSTSFPVVEHKYRVLGDLQVKMTPFFYGCPGQPVFIDLHIIGVVADYKFKNICSARNHFIYQNLSSGNISSFRWTFSDIPNTPDIVNFHTSHDFPLNGSFNTKFYLFDAITGCSDSLITEQYTATPIFTSSKTSVCKDSLIEYKVLNPYPDGSGYSYEFHVDGTIIAHTTYPHFELPPFLQGTFNEFVIISGHDDNTCDDTAYLPKPTSVTGPVLDVSFPINTCLLNNSYPFTNNTHPFFPDQPIATWEWDFGDGTSSNVAIPPPHVYDHYGTFWVHYKVTDVNGCAQKDSQLVRVNPTPEIHVLPQKDTLCAGESLNLFSFTVDPFVWTTGSNLVCQNPACDTVLVNPMTSTNYIAEATNIFGCANRDTSKIKVYEPFVLQVSPSDTSICIGGQVKFNTNIIGITNWSPPDHLSSITIPDPVSKPDTTITYQVIIKDSASCFEDRRFATIHVNYLPTVNAGPDKIVPYYNSFTLSPAYSADAVDWRWSPPVNSLSCLTCPVVTGIAEQTTTYTIEAKTEHGCTATDQVMVIVACSKANLLLPSGFTPDNNGRNDWFYPIARGYKKINKFVVYNRWGNKIFERYDFPPNIASLGWNGRTSNNITIDPGVFVWVIEATCDMGQKVESKGTVVVVR